MKKLRERQVSLRMALTMCAAAGAITAVICLISTGWNTNEVGKKLREIDRLVSDKYVGELDADNVADYAAATSASRISTTAVPISSRRRCSR